MDDKKLQELYSLIVSKDASYANDVSLEQFKVKMQDEAYYKKMQDWIGASAPPQNAGVDIDAFLGKVKKKEPSVSLQRLPEQEPTLASSSEDVSSASSSQNKNASLIPELIPKPSVKEQLPIISEEQISNEERDWTRKYKQENEQIARIEKVDSEKTKVDKKKFEQEFEQGAGNTFDKNNNKYLNDRLKTITPELITKNEEFVVPKLNYQFGDLGFTFEETGVGDYMIVTAPDKKTTTKISLDPFDEARLVNQKAVSESKKLQQFIKDNATEKGLYVIEKSANELNKKIDSQKDIDASIKKIADEANGLNVSLKSFLDKKSSFDKMPSGNENYNKIQAELIAERDELLKKQDNLKTKEVLLNKSVGKYTEMKAQQGSYLEGTFNALLDSFASDAAGIVDAFIDGVSELMPNEALTNPSQLKEDSFEISKKLGIAPPTEKQTFVQWKATLTEDQQDDVEDKLDDIIKKRSKKDLIPLVRQGNRELFGSSNATPEWEQLKSESFWGGAYFGLVKTVPALIGGKGATGWAQRTANMYAMVSDGIRKEMDANPDFDNVSENEKLGVVFPIGMTASIFEEFGLMNIKGSTGVINRIAMSALGKSGIRTTAKTFREFVENEVESALAKGLLTIGSAGLAEFESGAAQEFSETGIKAIYNQVKGKKMFETPETIGEWVKDIVIAGAQEAVGGFVLGMPTAVSAAYSQKGFLNMDDQTFKMFESAANDENIQKAFITKLKTQITQGVITTAEAKEQLNNYRNSVGLFRSLTEGLNTQQKKEAMNLLKEKRDLENQVDGKDSSLSAKLKERIAAIDASLVEISEVANNEKVIAETNKKEFDALPDEEKTKLKESISNNVRQIYGDVLFLNLDDDEITELALRQFVSQKKKGKRIAEIEAILSPDAETQVSDRQKNKLKKELDTLVAKPNTEGLMPIEEIFENADSESLKNKESTAKALESLAADKTEGSTFTDNEGNAVPVVGNENTLAELYHEAVDTPMEQRTEAQNSAMDVVKKSLNEKVKLEKIFVEDTAPTQDDSRSASNESDMKDMKGRVKGQAKVKVIESAQRAIKTLKSILPNFDIHIHEDEGSYNAATQKVKGEAGSKGSFYSKGDGTGRIDINLSRADVTTVAHEVAHAVMLKAFGSDPILFKNFKDKISKVLSDSSNKGLMDFANQYKGDVKYEEYLVQFAAMLSQQEKKISPTIFQKIAEIINSTVSFLTKGALKPFDDVKKTNDIIEFFNNIAESISKGEDINIKESSKGLQNETSKSQKGDVKRNVEIENILNPKHKGFGKRMELAEKKKIGTSQTFKEDKNVNYVFRNTTKEEVDNVLSGKEKTGDFWRSEPNEYKNYGDYVIIKKAPNLKEYSRNYSKGNKIENDGFNYVGEKVGKEDIDFIYNKKTGEIIYNNNPELVNAVEQSSLPTQETEGTSKSQKADNEKIATEKIQELGALLGVDLGKPFSKSQLSDSPLPKPVVTGFNILKKKFGETAAEVIRKKIPFALDYPNEFVEFITKKIPSKDDIPFIVKQMGSRLDGLFRLEYDKNIKTAKGITKTPEELSKLAGYVFHRTESMDDVLVFKKDFREIEVLCTISRFLDSGADRTKQNTVFWLRKNGAETILPSDLITNEYLQGDSIGAGLWREYLEIKGLKNFDGTYNISSLSKSRQDPYGISSMSVQIGKTGVDLDIGDLSIKNRYNHKVESADATFENNLNNIIDGLHDAVYAIEGVAKKSNEKIKLPDGIVSDAKGNFFRFDRIINNVHFSQNGYMKDGVITIIDKSTQRMVDDYLVDSKSKQIKSVTSDVPQLIRRNLVDNINKISIEKNKISIDTTDGNLILDLQNGILIKASGSIANIGNYFLSNNESLTSISLPNNTDIGDGFLLNNKSLTSISLPNNINIGSDFLRRNESLTSISLPNNINIGSDFLMYNKSLTSISLPNNTTISNSFLYSNQSLTNIELPKNVIIGNGFLSSNQSLTNIELPKNAIIGDNFLRRNKALASIELPNNTDIGNSFLSNNESLTSISLPNNIDIGTDFLVTNKSLTSISLPNNIKIGNDFVHQNESLTSISLPNNRSIGNSFLYNNESLTSISLPNNTDIGNSFLYQNKTITSILLPNNTEIGGSFLSNNKSLTSISLPNNTDIGNGFLSNNESLTSISLPNNTDIGNGFLDTNKSLTSISLPNNISIDSGFLYENKFLTSISLPNNKNIKGKFLFSNESLTSIELPNNKFIGDSFLSNNESLTSISLPKNTDIGDDFLFSNQSLTSIELPNNTIIGKDFLPNNESIKAQSKSQLTEKNISEMVKKARAEGLSDEAIRKRLLSNGISSSDIDIAMESTETSSSKIEVNEQRMPGYDAMLSEARAIREKLKNKNRSESDTNNSVMAYVMGSDFYKNASDIQTEAIVRQIRKDLGLREKSAPKVTNLLDGDMITVSSKVLVLEKIKALVRGGKDAVKAIKVAQEQLKKEIKERRKSGKITAAQLERVMGRLGKTDLLSPTATARFIDYMGKVFADAEYGQKISDAYKTRSQILSLTENKDKNVDLKTLGVEFAKIEPSTVEDIDAYNDMANSIEEAIRGSTIKKDNTKFAASVRISSAMEYVKATLETQERLITEERIAEIQELMGIDATGFSAREMIDLLKSPEPLTKYNEPNIRALVSRAFDAYKSIIEQELKSGIDAFTGEPVYYTAAERKAIREFMEMDTDKMPTAKEGLDAVDSLINFLANKSTAKMMSVTAKYNGQQNVKKVVAKKIASVKLKKLYMPGLARTLAEEFTNLNIVFEKMFKGFNRSRIVTEAMGLLNFINRKAYAQNKSKIIVSDYINRFYKKGVRPNGQAFNTAYNEIERGMAAFMMRNVIDSPEQRAIEFDRRKRLIKQSIDTLSGGNEKEQKKGKLYEEAYNKIAVDAEGINDIIANTDKINLDAIDYWHKQWDANFEQMASTSIGIYNKILERESNFSPDRFSKVDFFKGKQIDLDNDESAYHTNNGTLYKRAAGSLQKAERPSNLGELNEKGELSKVEHYINLSFDRNNSNSMYDALVDIETAASIRQVQAFMNSDDFKKIVPYAEDRKLLKNRIDLYIRISRGKESYSDDELSKFMRGLNKVSTIGIGQALGGITQPAKQVIPIAFNTIINGGGLNVVSVFDKDFTTWLESIAMPISNRGVQSQAEIDNINAKIQEAADNKGEQLLNLIESANKWWLKVFLVAPDVFIARASWKGYYEKALAKQGIDVKGLDYSTHEVNMEAANYAQGMVDRQQNISDHDMSGKAFVSKEVKAQIIVKSLMAFASFRMNAASRTAADLSTIGHWSVSTKEDKVIALRSLAGYAVEQAVFKYTTYLIGLGIGTLGLAIMGKDEDDEELKKRKNNLIKGAATGAVTDFFSPIPVTDKLIQDISVWTLDQTQSLVGVSDEDKLSLFGTIKESFLKGAGTFGIAIEKASQLIDLVDLSYSGTYIDDYGKEKKITEEDREALSMFILPAIMTNIGLAPSEVSSLVRSAVKSSKKAYKTDAERAESEQKDREETKENREKINALVELKSNTSSSAEIDFINKKIRELNLEGEEKKEFKKAKEEENKIKNAKKERLLKGFENQSDMKRYAPEEWERNFGEGSEWYRDNSAEMEVNKNLRKEEREEKEDLYNYVEPSKSKKKSTGWGTVTKKKSTGWGSANKKKNKGWGSK